MYWSRDLKDKNGRLTGRFYQLARVRRRTYVDVSKEIVGILRDLPDDAALELPEGLVFAVSGVKNESQEEATVIVRRLTDSSVSVTPAYLVEIKNVRTPIMCGNGVMVRTGGAGAWDAAAKLVRAECAAAVARLHRHLGCCKQPGDG